MAVVRDVVVHEVLTDLVVGRAGIDPDPVGAVGTEDRRPVVLDLVRLDEVRAGHVQEDAAARVVVDVVPVDGRVGEGGAEVGRVAADRDRVREIAEHVVVRDLDAAL